MHDFHTHFIPQDVLSWLKDHQATVHATWEQTSDNKAPFLTVNHKWGFELKQAFYDIDLYTNQQKEAGITHSLLSPIPQLFMYDFPPDITSEIATVYNQALVHIVQSSSENLSALATVPLNHPEQAAATLQEAIHQGLKGAIIGPGLSGKMLSDPFFAPFFEEANRLKAIVFIHPLLSEDARLKQRMMPNLIGVPWETTVYATDILLSGMADTYPNVKILFAHGGGFLPYQIGRLDKGYEQWKKVSANLQAPPSHYLKRFWYDSVLWSEDALAYLIQAVGEDHVVPGSDYPFDLCVWPPTANGESGSHLLLPATQMKK